MTEFHHAAISDEPTTEAGSLVWVIEPHERELVRARAIVRQWLASSPLGPTARGDIEVVVSEAAATLLAVADDERPVELRCRYTHSLAVIEATRAGADSENPDEVQPAAGSEAGLRETLLSLLTTRVVVTTVATRTTVRCTLSLVPDPDGGE
jgi:hypothetical protein